MAEAAGAQELEAVSALVKALEPHVGRDWEVPAGQLEWSCQATAVHVAHDLAAYSAQLASGSSQRYLPFDLVIRAQATASDVLQLAKAWGKVLAVVVEAAGPEDRAWHFGPTDRAAFAAMGIGEVLVHTYDTASGLGLDWRPPRSSRSWPWRGCFPTRLRVILSTSCSARPGGPTLPGKLRPQGGCGRRRGSSSVTVPAFRPHRPGGETRRVSGR